MSRWGDRPHRRRRHAFLLNERRISGVACELAGPGRSAELIGFCLRIDLGHNQKIAAELSMRLPRKIIVMDRFAPLRTQLLALLGGLSETDWTRPTAAPLWSVKDVAAHLLGGDIGILSRERGACRPNSPAALKYNELVDIVNRLNQEWAVAARRISPRLLCELLAFTGPAVEEYFSSLDPEAMGGPVSWAGTDPAPVWFDIAREFTERWHHQQQIRDATGRAPLYQPYFLSPVLDTFVRALPRHFRETIAPAGAVVRFEISGESGGVWYLHRAPETWILALDSSTEPAADAILTEDTAWRLFTKGINRSAARSQALVRGDASLTDPIFATTAIIG